jgi:hypothetical protein
MGAGASALARVCGHSPVTESRLQSALAVAALVICLAVLAAI